MPSARIDPIVPTLPEYLLLQNLTNWSRFPHGFGKLSRDQSLALEIEVVAGDLLAAWAAQALIKTPITTSKAPTTRQIVTGRDGNPAIAN
jgi:hypothetical protein